MIRYSFLLVFMVFLGCKQQGSDKQEQTDKKGEMLELAVSHPQSLQPQYRIKLTGELQPQESVALFSKVKGFVRQIHVDVGDYVQKGQLLARMEAPEMDVQSTSDRAKQHQLLANYEVSKLRYKRLHDVDGRKKGAISALELERAYGDMLRDSAAVVEAGGAYQKSKYMEDYLLIRAPFSGVITQRNFSTGALLGDSGVPMFNLVANDKLKLKVVVPEVHGQAVSDSTVAEFQVLSIPNRTFTTKLKRNAKFIDPTTRSLSLEFEVPNGDKSLIGGDFADVQLSLKRAQKTIFVPKEAVVNAQSGVFVIRVVEDGKTERVPVRLGISYENLVEVFGPITTEDRVVNRASEELTDGKVVKALMK
ncbi:efflux RND transporter periplasmic adaptor subunit [Sphingobacterium faecale]|uniref:Efflux RND transporter periplasmic adaptor subunit n=1 Tax=Sphingobacterium faecale TaxID=2803775 RepID=A0ABS1R0W8_9SPHI|nr:efflux RND transporter periplasmic adaptor subunit [Sphingobacterium faecale]MBL1408323.1 efflux RND transporter periplasmic adaptor subunit [Sphingobacterium faecale]